MSRTFGDFSTTLIQPPDHSLDPWWERIPVVSQAGGGLGMACGGGQLGNFPWPSRGRTMGLTAVADAPMIMSTGSYGVRYSGTRMTPLVLGHGMIRLILLES